MQISFHFPKLVALQELKPVFTKVFFLWDIWTSKTCFQVATVFIKDQNNDRQVPAILESKVLGSSSHALKKVHIFGIKI